MNYGEAAELSSTLLFRKGGAIPTGLRPPRSKPRSGATLHVASSRAEPDPNAPVRLSVKLDRPRHQHLRLAAAKLGVSTQTFLQNAVEHYLRTAVPAQIASNCQCLMQSAADAIVAAAPPSGAAASPVVSDTSDIVVPENRV